MQESEEAGLKNESSVAGTNKPTVNKTSRFMYMLN